MADNPLLPQHRLRKLHALMQHIRKLDRQQPHGPAREALLGAVLLHLDSGDLLSGPANDHVIGKLAPRSPGSPTAGALPPRLRLPLSAGAARGMLAAGTDRITLALAESGTAEPGWIDALTWAHRDQLPFLLVCADPQTPAKLSRKSASRGTPALSWTSLSQVARRLRLPVFPVDGLDAVAVYRVMQESSARARARGGPSVLWATLDTSKLPRRQQPLPRLETYMSQRGISLKP